MTEYNKYFWQKTVRDSGLSFADQGIVQAMGTYSNKDGLNVRVSQETIAALGGCSTKTVERAVKKAVAVGLLHKVRDAVNRGPNSGPAIYRLTVPACYWGEPQRRGTPFYPNIEQTPVSDEWDFEQTPMSGEPVAAEHSTDISAGLNRHLDPFEQTFEADSTDTHVALTGFNNPSTEREDHFGPSGPSRTPLRSADAGWPRVQPPLMQSVPTSRPTLSFGQPRLFLEARLGRELHEAEEVLAASMDAKGKSRTAILIAIQGLRIPA